MEQRGQFSNIPADMTVGFIGAGRMAQAMIRGFISTGNLTSVQFVCVDRRQFEFEQTDVYAPVINHCPTTHLQGIAGTMTFHPSQPC